MSLCPVCAFESNDDIECQNCGHRLEDDALLALMEVDPLEGLELTQHSVATVTLTDSSMVNFLEVSGGTRQFKTLDTQAAPDRCRMCGVVAVYDKRCRQCGERHSENSGDNA